MEFFLFEAVKKLVSTTKCEQAKEQYNYVVSHMLRLSSHTAGSHIAMLQPLKLGTFYV
jgi:hypothetical protein